MQSQLTRHVQEAEAPIAVHHPEDEGHDHEKKPTKVLKKVNEKAKKIKDTLTKHGHDDQDRNRGERVPDDHDLDEEDDGDEDEEKIQDTEVHGASMYESAAVRSGTTGQAESLSHPGKAHLPTPEEVVPPGTKVFPVFPSGSARPTEPVGGSAHPMKESEISDQEKKREALKTPENSPVTRTFVSGQVESLGQQKINVDTPTELEEDPTAPISDFSSYFSNYQTKVTDPNGEGGEIEETNPMIQSFLKMKVIGEGSDVDIGPGLEKELARKGIEFSFSNISIGSHHQFSLELSPPKPVENSPSETEEVFDIKGQPKQGSNTEKSRGEEEETPKSAVEYGKVVVSTVTEKLTPVYEKVKEAGTSVMTKMPLYETGNDGQDRGILVRNYLAEKLKPGEEDRALSEVIAEQLHLNEKKERKRGRVTESKEVAERLGGFGDRKSDGEMEYGESVVGDEKTGGIVEKLKEAFGSWLSGTTEKVTQESSRSLQESSQSLSSTIGTVGLARCDLGKTGGADGQRRLPESGN